MEDPQRVAYYELGGIRIVRGSGLRIWDSDDNEYLDCVSGTFNLVLGHNHPEVVEELKSQADRLIFASSMFQADATNELMAELVEISPPNLTRVNLRSSGGSTANEGAIKIAQLHTGRRDVITLFRSHVGQTMAMASFSGFARLREPFPTVGTNAVRVPDPYCSRCFYLQEPETCGRLCVDRIDDFLTYSSSGSVACMLVEPISGVGGNIIPPPGYLERLKEFCAERGIVLIFDENQTSLGRTGHMFAADALGVHPHMMTLSKGLSGLGLPLAAILTEESLVGMDRSLHGFTFGGGVLAAATSLATLRIIRRPGFLEQVRSVGQELLDSLRRLQARYEIVFEVRGLGLMLGVEIAERTGAKSSQLANELHRSLLQHRVITRVSEHGRGNVIELRPPLTLTSDEAQEIVGRFETALADVVAKG